MTQKKPAEERLQQMLQVAGLPVKPSYCTSEVCSILGIGVATYWRLLAKYELDETGALRRPDCLDSFLLTNNSRVVYHELVAYLERNKTYTRQNAVDPDQMALFAD
jgi:hypothetical protein